jgi:hypothetical protein
MRPKLRIYLPVSQVALAISLMIISGLEQHRSGEEWLSPTRQWCFGLNAPAALLNVLVQRLASAAHLPVTHLEDMLLTYVSFVVFVGALWYLVAKEISTLYFQNSAVGTGRTRKLRDLGFISFGLLLLWLGAMNVSFDARSARWGENPISIGNLIWGAVIVIYYSHDLYFARNALTGRKFSE